jgi:hydrogenase nickel incorporation protein HypA/HybF
MHEFAIGEELVKAVLGEMERLTPPPRNLRSVRVVVGALRRVSPEHLRFAYEVLTRDTPAAGAALEVTMVPVTALCRDCGWQGEIDEMLFLCQDCGAANLQTLQGMELFLDRLEVEYSDASDSE